ELDPTRAICIARASARSRQGVDLKRRPPKSRPAAPFEDIRLPSGRGAQGLRRPRFSFFRFTCQTARDQGGPPPGEPESRRSLWPPIEIGCLVTNIIDELQRRAIAPRRRRAKLSRYIGVRTALCQRPTGRKSTLPVQSGNNHLLK